jgi:hypothetical protein
VTGSVLDVERVLRWIEACEERHGGCAAPLSLNFSDAFRGLHILRLIDVDAGCLVETSQLERYVALSYVWGSVPNLRLTKANRTAMLAPNALEQVFQALPPTIQDAIVLVQRLRARYLWVDSLCLLQNDGDDLQHGVNAMDLIYERAWLTIVAACGHDANARLPGVQQGTRLASRNTVPIAPGI